MGPEPGPAAVKPRRPPPTPGARPTRCVGRAPGLKEICSKPRRGGTPPLGVLRDYTRDTYISTRPFHAPPARRPAHTKRVSGAHTPVHGGGAFVATAGGWAVYVEDIVQIKERHGTFFN
jgi:hypothetical protein